MVFLREVRVIEPYTCKVGSKEAGQKWSELASHINEYDDFKEMPRDQRSVREHFNKLIAEFKSKMKKEENSTGCNPDPPSEKDILLEEIVELMNSQPKESEKKHESERKKALDIRNQAMKTWSKSMRPCDDSDENDSDHSSDDDKSTKRRGRKKRRRTGDAFKYLEVRSAQEASIRKEELQLRKEEKEIEQERIQLERAKLEQMQQQMQQQQQQMLIQQNLMIALLGKLADKEQ